MTDHDPTRMDPVLRETADRTVVAAVVASIAAANPTLGLLVGAGVPAFEHALQSWRQSQASRIERVLSVASQQADMEAEAMLTRIAEDERLLAEMAATITAASRTALDAKIDALGRSLGTLAADSARIDPEALWIRILTDLEALHIRVLLELQQEDPEQPGHLRLWDASRLSHVTDSTAMASVILLTLERHGLAQRVNVNTLSQQTIARWGISTDGRVTWWMRGNLAVECLDRLRLSGN